ncbi:hypothetical protein L596_006168 [Steinernema carpocapsae]|uniref:EGF-like domain-containing protein n=1 Tax=Steinernema carpocapsae TaxID=34508 RepID=A0A4V6I8X4_STECR|nr:hypothetical protein L596_006168 [Steinernema carpocapsae]
MVSSNYYFYGCATNKLRTNHVYHAPITLEKAKIKRNCSKPADTLWCHNNGVCHEVLESTGYKKTCLCRDNFVGRRCETIYNPYLTEFALQQRLETAALPILITFIILLTCVLSCALYLFRRDARSYSIGSPYSIANPNSRLDINDCI